MTKELLISAVAVKLGFAGKQLAAGSGTARKHLDLALSASINMIARGDFQYYITAPTPVTCPRSSDSAAVPGTHVCAFRYVSCAAVFPCMTCQVEKKNCSCYIHNHAHTHAIYSMNTKPCTPDGKSLGLSRPSYSSSNIYGISCHRKDIQSNKSPAVVKFVVSGGATVFNFRTFWGRLMLLVRNICHEELQFSLVQCALPRQCRE